ncbi:hypothetical protein [Streptomyces sp. NBC_00236]|uniref:hypothetical protein n=1 Tax=Streptomyces sp. NBC_00236 TaxID=2903639 RepID=UPI002E2AC9FE|nr:hypothetical protein [Streptomyces sp. NBC_00236]
MRITRNRPGTRSGPAGQFNGSFWIDGIAAPEPEPPSARLALVEAAEGGSTIHWHTDPGVPEHPAA